MKMKMKIAAASSSDKVTQAKELKLFVVHWHGSLAWFMVHWHGSWFMVHGEVLLDLDFMIVGRF